MRTGAVLLLLAAMSSIWPTFLAQESLQRDFPCTQEEYECLLLGRLLYPKDGKCYEIYSSCSVGYFFRANKTLAQEEGRLQGECLPLPCNSSNELVAAATGRCEEFRKICDVRAGFRYNVWGEAVCGYDRGVEHSKQPKAPWKGRCHPPRRMIPEDPPAFRKIFISAGIPCTEREHQCYEKEQVLFRGKCWPLREQGPCDQGEWLILDENAVQISEFGTAAANNESRIVPICVRRPCPSGELLPVPGSIVGDQCISTSLLRRRMCAGTSILMALDVFGRGGCASFFALQVKEELPRIRNKDHCYLPSWYGYSAVSNLSGMDCPRDTDGNCTPLSQLKSRAKYILLPED